MAQWDIFCCVVDNYGDIGVTWRLARQLAGEHGQQVRLWVDDPQAFARLCPHAVPGAARQWQSGVEVCHWVLPWEAVEPADVVIEAFACELPLAYRQAMAQRGRPPLWLNLEYLSAESWVEGCHALPSLQADGLRKYFWFPGFTPATGGLLREGELLAQRSVWQGEDAHRQAFLATLGVEWQGERLISLFAYEQPQLGVWLDLLAAGMPTLLLVPEGRVLGDVERWCRQTLIGGQSVHRGALRVQRLPFVSQEDYDRLLWSCDLNAVRGEDSFVRAQWAGRPFLWHIYAQDEGAHLLKLEAFLAHYLAGAAEAIAAPLRTLWHAWNAAATPDELAQAWQQLERHLPSWQAHASTWCTQLAAQTDLATGLVQFHAGWLE
ncbi:elongation factor P maturation arginine rhamnosyltransferase EarP [Pseudomonas sp. NW5]|uniref:elongation factor P maturation arginine rhamnosyltransferase EarP n=1 Tax=Pseudomonas sp. NW5 TaxID=2934934 RepID=UPI002021E724|nr:elongation factor P maturation arginine rhamnosyltransferase EarP [Pseudomonas sp. NW5]MCL7462862.1 elongation factor P maturation arginine rhamnosyltransferase EarP [Pseudomonas sp. NW5]